MRIVQVVHGLPPQNRAGSEILTLELSRALQARGHHVTIIARTFAPECEEFSLQEEQDEHGLRIIRLVNNGTRTTHFRLHYDSPFFHDTFRRLLHQCRADIVHFQHVAHLSASLIPCVSSLGYPTVLSLHDFFFACSLIQLIDGADQLCPGPQRGERCVACLHDLASAEAVRHRFAYMTQVLQVPRRVIVPSAFLARRTMDDFPFLHDRLQVIAPGLPLPPGSADSGQRADAVDSGRDASGRPGQPLRIVYVGVLLPHKGAHVLIDALRGIPTDRIHASFYGAEVAGRQAYAEQLRESATGLPVHWGGVYDRSELQAILAEHDVLVMPVIWEETFSLVTREALQAGLPVIAARRGALPDIIQDGRNGLLFEPENAEDLRRCLRRLLDEPDLLAQLKSDPFTWRDADAYARDVEQAYETVLAQSDPAPRIAEAAEGVLAQRERSWLEDQVRRWRELVGEREQLVQEQDAVLQQQDTALEQHRAVVQQQDTALEQHRAVVQQQDTALEQHRAVVQQQDTALEQHRAVVQQQDTALKQHRAVVQQQDTALETLRSHLHTRDQDIHTLTVDLEQHREALANHKALVTQLEHQQDTALEQHRAVVQQQDTALETLRSHLHTRDQDIHTLTVDLEQHREALADHKALVTQLEHQRQEEGQRTQALEDALHRIYGSMGWRVLSRFYFVRERLVAPPGTRRGRLYHKLKRVGEIYASGGWRAVFTKLREYTKRPLTPPRPLAPPLDPYQVEHTVTPEQLHQQRIEMTTFSFQPTVSILMPVYNTHEPWLRRAVTSVQNQVYPHWELCICDDGSSQTVIHDLLNEFAQHDPRIHVSFSPTNEGIAAASNHALQLATGEFVGLLDHDDELSPHALFEVVKYLNAHPDTDLVYSDEDKIDPHGQRVQPFFKPDWCPDMLLSFMYTCHFSVYRRERLTEVGGFDPDCDGSQDYDLALKVTERTDAIGHIPHVLYHWRIVPGSVAERATNKWYAYEAGKRALTAALKRRKIVGSVEDTFGKKEGLGFYRIKRACETAPLVSIIIPTRDRLELLSRCIASIEEYTTYPNYEIVIVDNDSSEPQTHTYFQQVSHRVISYPGDFHFSRMMNAAARQVSGEQLLFLNNDMEVLNAGWLEALVEHASRSEVGAVGAKLLYPNHTVQHAGVVIGLCEFAGHSHRHLSGFQHGYWGSVDIIRNYSAVTAACMMLRRSLFAEVGGFVEAFQYAYQDVDLCLRLRERGLLIVYTPYAQLVHYESASRGGAMAFGEHDIALARERWPQYLTQGDPYYSPHLTQRGEDFSLNVETNGAL